MYTVVYCTIKTRWRANPCVSYVHQRVAELVLGAMDVSMGVLL